MFSGVGKQCGVDLSFLSDIYGNFQRNNVTDNLIDNLNQPF